MKEEEREGENSEALREARGPLGDAEERKADGHRPVWERSFFQITDAIFVERNPVVKREHLAAGFGVSAVGIVEQRRAEQTRDEDGGPQKENREKRRPLPSGWDAHARTRVETMLDRVGLGTVGIFKNFSMATESAYRDERDTCANQ